MGTLTTSSFRQIGEIGDDNFLFELQDSAGAKHLITVAPNDTWGFWKSNTYLAALGSQVSSSVVAQYAASYPSAGFVGEDVTNTSAPRIPLPVGVQAVQLFGPSNVPANGIAFVPTFVPSIGFTTNASGNNAGNLPVVTNGMGTVNYDPYKVIDTPNSNNNDTVGNIRQTLGDLWTTLQNNPILMLLAAFLIYKIYQAATKKGDFLKNLLG